MSETPDSYEVLAEPAALFALAAEWDALLAGSREQRFSQSCAWCRATWDAVDAPRGRSLLALVVRNDARMVALWPVVLYRTGHWKVARPLGCAFGEYSDVLVLDDVKAEARALAAWRELRRVSGCDIVRLTDVRTGSLLHEMMQRERQAGVASSVATLSVEWGEVDWNTYVASLQGDNRRKQTARNRRRLQRMGTLVFEHSDAPARRQELIKWLFQHKVEQLARSERKSVWLDTNAYRDLLCSMAEPKSSLGCLMTFALVLDGTVLAALMARVDSGCLEMLNTVFHPEWGRLGPGGVLFEDTLRWACDRGVDFDMRIGDFPYKRAWSNREYPAITYEVVNSMWGTAYVTHRLSKERLRAIARRLPESLRHAAKRALRQSRSSA